jgi:hypothetical protein
MKLINISITFFHFEFCLTDHCFLFPMLLSGEIPKEQIYSRKYSQQLKMKILLYPQHKYCVVNCIVTFDIITSVVNYVT